MAAHRFRRVPEKPSDIVRKFALCLVLAPICFGWLAPWACLAALGAGLVLLGAWGLHAFLQPLFR